MPHPKEGYWLEPEHERVPGTTTILGRFKDAGPLIHWAWKLGTEGQDYRKVRDDAASIGTIAHSMVESWIHKEEFDRTPHSQEFLASADRSFTAFLDWAAAHKFQVTDTEVRLVSRKWRFGGTPDGFLVDGKRVIVDFKTSASVYPEYLCQLAAYRALWNEIHPDDLCEDGGHILRFDKTYGDFGHFHFTDLADAWEAFKHMRGLYDLMGRLSKRVK